MNPTQRVDDLSYFFVSLNRTLLIDLPGVRNRSISKGYRRLAPYDIA